MNTTTLPAPDAVALARLHAFSVIDDAPRPRRRHSGLPHLLDQFDEPEEMPELLQTTIEPVLADLDLDDVVVPLGDAHSPFKEMADARNRQLVQLAKRRRNEHLLLGFLPPLRLIVLAVTAVALYLTLWTGGNLDHRLVALVALAAALCLYTRASLRAQFAAAVVQARSMVW